MAHDKGTPVVEMRGVKKYYRVTDGFRHTYSRAVDGVDISVYPGETFGVVGESGCGKSTAARLIMCLEKPTEGEIYFRGERIDNMSESRLHALRPRFQMVFQDSGSSLNPRKRVTDIIAEPMLYHGVTDKKSAAGRVHELLSLVGLPREAGDRYPHEFSGGQRQRICIARALSLNPELLILDEPVSALDVSVQAQILNLIRDLQKELHLTCIFIGHGLGAVRYVSRRIAVMYMGRVVECAESEALFSRPAHPYTKALLDAAPSADFSLRNRPRIELRGEAGGIAPRGGCPFFDRCPEARAECADILPPLTPIRDGSHLSACPYSR